MSRTLPLSILALTCVFLLGGRWRMIPLDEATIVVLPAGGCAGLTSFEVEVQFEDLGWTKLDWAEPDTCIAMVKQDIPSIRACCTFAGQRTCLEATLAEESFQCARILDVRSGREYDASDVEAWNAAHSGG